MQKVHIGASQRALSQSEGNGYGEWVNKQPSPMKALQTLLKTDNAASTLVLRLTLGVVMFPHGAQKVLGWFGGAGLSGTVGFFTQQMHIPLLFALLAIAAEFAGSIGLLLGLFSRVAAFGIGSTMLVAIFMGHLGNGFFMNWSGTQAGEGFEYHLLAIGIAVAIILKGGGKASVDSILARNLNASKS